MTMKYQIFLISDSTGETLDRIFLALQSQFANFDYEKKEFVFIRTEQQIDKHVINMQQQIDQHSQQSKLLPNSLLKLMDINEGF